MGLTEFKKILINLEGEDAKTTTRLWCRYFIPCRVIISRPECRCMLCSETEEASMALARRLRAEDEAEQLQRDVQASADAKLALGMHKIE